MVGIGAPGRSDDDVPANLAPLADPVAVLDHPAGLLVADQSNRRVVLVDADGLVRELPLVDGEALGPPGDLELAADGRVLVSDPLGGRALAVEPATGLVETITIRLDPATGSVDAVRPLGLGSGGGIANLVVDPGRGQILLWTD